MSSTSHFMLLSCLFLTLATSPKAGYADVFGQEIFQEMDVVAGSRFKPGLVAHQAFDEPVSCVKLSYQLGVPEHTEELFVFVTKTLGDLGAHRRALSGPDQETQEYRNAFQALELLDVFFGFFPYRALPNIVAPGSPEWTGLSADWNSGCVDSELGYSDVRIPSTAWIRRKDLRERISLSGERIIIEGQIETGFSDRLEQTIRSQPEAKIVAISSAGAA